MTEEPPSPRCGPQTHSQFDHENSDADADGQSKGLIGGILRRLGIFRRLQNGPDLRKNLQLELQRTDEGSPAFSPKERLLIGNILRLRELRIDDIMIPRANIDAVECSVSLGKLLRAFRVSGHSRLPIYRGNLDNPLGMIHIKDLMMSLMPSAGGHEPMEKKSAGASPRNDPARTEDKARKYLADIALNGAGRASSRPDKTAQEASREEEQIHLAPFGQTEASLQSLSIDQLQNIIRPVIFVPPSMPAAELMAKMQASRVQMALVIDEYGGTDGLVSLEDLIETVVGDIEDEYDAAEIGKISPSGENAWRADARTPIEDFEQQLGGRLADSKLSEEVDSLGGLLFTAIARVPIRGEVVSSPLIPGFEFEILDADPRRIKQLRIRRSQASEDAGQAHKSDKTKVPNPKLPVIKDRAGHATAPPRKRQTGKF